MIPIRDTAPSRYPAIMVWGLIGINVVVFVLEASLGEAGIEQLFNQYGFVPAHLSIAPGSPANQSDQQDRKGKWFSGHSPRPSPRKHGASGVSIGPLHQHPRLRAGPARHSAHRPQGSQDTQARRRVARARPRLCGDELQELRVVLEVFHDNSLETGNLVRSISIHGVASPAGHEERAMSVERDS